MLRKWLIFFNFILADQNPFSVYESLFPIIDIILSFSFKSLEDYECQY